MIKEMYVDAYGFAYVRILPEAPPPWESLGYATAARPGLYIFYEDGAQRTPGKQLTEDSNKGKGLDFSKFSNSLHELSDIKSSIERNK